MPDPGTPCSPGVVIVNPAPVYVPVVADDEGALPPGRSTRTSFVLWNVHSASIYAGFDFSSAGVCAADDPDEDLVYRADDSGEYFDVSHDTDIRDLGDGTGDEVAEAPQRSEWSPVHSVEAIAGHTYLIWTWDDQFYRFAVNGVSDQVVRCDWTSVDEDVHYSTRGIARNGSSRPVFVRTKFPR